MADADALRQSHGQLVAVLSSCSSILIAVDTGGLVIVWNSGAEKVFGLREDLILGKPFLRCPIPWDWDRIEAQIPGGIPTRTVRLAERFARRDGSHGVVSFQVKPQFKPGHKLNGCLWLGSDSGQSSVRLAPEPQRPQMVAPQRKPIAPHAVPAKAQSGDAWPDYPVHLSFLDSHLVSAGEDPAQWRIMKVDETRLDEDGMEVCFTLSRRHAAQSLMCRRILIARGELVSIRDR